MLTDLIEKYSTPILKEKRLDSSGIFIQYKNRFFLLSSAHQFWNNDKTAFQFIYNEKSIDLNGKHYYINPSLNDEQQDFDFSLLELSNKLKLLIPDEYFFNLESQQIEEPCELSKYFLFGFPSKVSFKLDKVRTYPLRLFFSANDIQIKNNFLGIKYSRRKLFLEGVQKSHGPKLKGCSGSGIWNISKKEPILMGILIEYNENSSKIKATFIQHITTFIESKLMFPQICP